MSENQTIKELLEKAKQRDIEAAKEILRRISDKMYFITRLFVADHEQARKVEQAGLKKVFSSLKEVTNPEWFECWAAEKVRKEAIAHVLPLEESTTNSNMYTEADEIPNYMAVLPETSEGKKYQVLEMMDKLSTGARAALALHLYDGLSVEESAKLLMSTPQSVMSWLTEAKDTLMSNGFNLGTLIVLMDKLNPVSDRAMVLKMQDDLALQSAEDDIISGVFSQPEETVTPVEAPSLPKATQKVLRDAEEESKDNHGLSLNICMNYGSRREILLAARKYAQDVVDGKATLDIEEEDFDQYMMTKDFPPVDLLIRTSGEQRISNYLLWQIAYAELEFVPESWPEFTPEVLKRCLEEYQNRDRRFGGVKNV